MKKYLFRDILIVTIITFFIFWILKNLYINIKILESGNQKNEDFDITDLVHTSKNKSSYVNPSIVLVNIGTSKREEIAIVLDSIFKKKPKVVALDIVFNSEKDSINKHLQKTLLTNKAKIVLAGYFTYHENNELGEFISSDSTYQNNIPTGFTNFVTSYNQGVVRRFVPFINYKGENKLSFAAQIQKKISPDGYKDLEDRNNNSELINYTHQVKDFLILQKDDIISNNFHINLENKIVILGYIGQNRKSHSLEDYHYTPLNNNERFPDMPGVIIHANIVEMLITQDYIKIVPNYIIFILSFIVCLYHLKLYLWVTQKWPLWYHLFSKIIQFISVAIITWWIQVINATSAKLFNFLLKISFGV